MAQFVTTGADLATRTQAMTTVVRCRVCFGALGTLAEHPDLAKLDAADRVCKECK